MRLLNDSQTVLDNHAIAIIDSINKKNGPYPCKLPCKLLACCCYKLDAAAAACCCMLLLLLLLLAAAACCCCLLLPPPCMYTTCSATVQGTKVPDELR
jgi:hypothetical protein